MKRIFQILALLIALGLLALFLWPNQEFTIPGKSTIGQSALGLLSLQNPWPWIAGGTLVFFLLFTLDARYIGILRFVLADKNHVVDSSLKRVGLFFLTVCLSGVIGMSFMFSHFKPQPLESQDGHITVNFTNEENITVPTSGTIEGESRVPVSITNSETGETISAQKTDPRIAWPINENYWVIVPQSILPGTYVVSASDMTRKSGINEYLRFTEIDRIIVDPSWNEEWPWLIIMMVMWATMSFILALTIYFRNPVSQEIQM